VALESAARDVEQCTEGVQAEWRGDGGQTKGDHLLADKAAA